MVRSAVVLIAFGGPESTDQVGPFMTALMGRPPAPPMLERVIARYRAIGGGSPLPKIVRGQAAAMEQQLTAEGKPVRVVAAFRYAEPSIRGVVAELARSGVERVVGVSDSPHDSRVTTGAYLDDLRAAAREAGIEAVAADGYFDQPDFLGGIAEKAMQALQEFENPDDTFVIFSAHSLPVEYIAGGDPYVDELLRTVAGVLERLPSHDWRIAYQSKGFGQGDWLEPTVETVLEELAASGHKKVLLIPAGFTSDHVETLFDIDIAIAGKARELGIEFRRAAALNDAPAFIRALCSVARPHLS